MAYKGKRDKKLQELRTEMQTMGPKPAPRPWESHEELSQRWLHPKTGRSLADISAAYHARADELGLTGMAQHTVAGIFEEGLSRPG